MNFNPYTVLGVPMSADFEALRASYRRLARENHPDIALDKSLATERMAQINRAWGMLGDAARRAEFDGQWRRHTAEQARQELLRREAASREAARARAQRAPVVSSQTASRSGSAKGGSKPGAKRGAGVQVRAGLGVKATSRGAARRGATLDASANQAASPQALSLMRKVTLAARLFHRDNNARGAIAMCRAVLLSDSRNVPARELLSEIFASQGRLEIAVMMLDQAIQIAPDDQFLRRKRDHLENARFPGGALRPIKRPGLWQRLRARFKKGK